MSSVVKNLSIYNKLAIPEGQGFSFGIVVADWNEHITHALFEGCKATLLEHGVPEEQLYIAQVPGTFELPVAGKWLAQKYKLDAVICIGCVIKGETKHDEYISAAVANALETLSVMSSIPFIFGVLTPNNEEQALERAGGKHGNKGVEAAVSALRMAGLRKELTTNKQKIGF